MTSIGEAEIALNSTIVGKIRVLGIAAASVIFPRLQVDLGITLNELTDPLRHSTGAGAAWELRALAGELRFAEYGDAISLLSWVGPRRYVRSSSYGAENSVSCVCELDPWRVETIERRRDGAPPRFYLQLWPTFLSGSVFLDAEVRSIELRVPREMWLEFLARSGGHQFEVIEIRYRSSEAESFRRGFERLREARMRFNDGLYDEAIAACRKAIEAIGHEAPVTSTGKSESDTPKKVTPAGEQTASRDTSSAGADNVASAGNDPLRTIFAMASDARRAKEYAGIVARLKQLGAFAHHDFGATLTYSRPEAQFIIRTTEGLIALVSELAIAAMRPRD